MSNLPEKRTVRVNDKAQSQRFIWLGLSTLILVIGTQQHVGALLTPKAIETTSESQLQNPWYFQEPQLPPLKEPSFYLPSEETVPGSNENHTSLVVKLKDRRVYVYQNKLVKATYPIAVGKPGWETPLGKYNVLDMQRNPAWQHPWNGKVIPPGPDNPLGVGWIGFWTDGRNFIGFHGTPEEKLVGQAVSHGCIRMRNQDILALYAVVNLGTPVRVEP